MLINLPSISRVLTLLCIFTFSLPPLLSGCAGNTPWGQVQTQEESIDFFVKHRQEFEELRDLLLKDKHEQLSLFSGGSYTTNDKDNSKLSDLELANYERRMKKLDLVSMFKGQDGYTKKPKVEFCISSIGLAGDGKASSIVYSGAQLDYRSACGGQLMRFDSNGWYFLAVGGTRPDDDQ